MPDQIDLSVIIVSYNSRELLPQCLRSIFEETRSINLEVVVVDNASTDGTRECIQKEFPAIRLVARTENVGFAMGCDEGIALSSGRYVALLNPDTLVVDKALERMVRQMDANPGLGACGCKLVYPDGALQPNTCPFPSIPGALYNYSSLFDRFPSVARRVVPDWVDLEPERSRTVDWCSGACLIVSRACIDQVGPLDKAFFLYSEDVDLCRRIKNAGWEIYYLADATVLHYEGASQDQIGRRRKRLQGDLQYLRKWRGNRYARAYHVVVWLCSIYRYARVRWQQLRHPEAVGLFSQEAAFYRGILLARF